jgi:nucleoside-diphosphate-sugar epimerase
MQSTHKKVALITGGTGFIGSHLVHRLISEQWTVHVIIRPSSDIKLLVNVRDAITTHIYDGSIESLSKVMELSRPQVVFHIASFFTAEHTSHDILPMLQCNLIFATQLVEVMVKQGVNKLINTGTSWQHFENKDYSPVCLYAATKQAFESILQYYTETALLQVITLKLFDSYGPSDPRGKLFSLLDKISVEKQMLAMSLGEQKINLVYIEDIIEAYLIAAQILNDEKLNYSHEIYAIGNDETLSLRDIVDIYEQELGEKLPIVWGEKSYRKREVMEPWDKGEKLKYWQPKVDIRQGIKNLMGERRDIN